MRNTPVAPPPQQQPPTPAQERQRKRAKAKPNGDGTHAISAAEAQEREGFDINYQRRRDIARLVVAARPPRQGRPLHTVRCGRGLALPLRQRTPFPHGPVVPLDLRAALGRAADRRHPRGQPGAADQGRYAGKAPARERRRAYRAAHLDHRVLRRPQGRAHQAPERTPPPRRASAPACPRCQATRAEPQPDAPMGGARHVTRNVLPKTEGRRETNS